MSVLQNALLGMLAKHPMSGYDLTKMFDLSIGNAWSAKHSQIYPELARLSAEGLIRPTGEDGARGRKTYEITDAGVARVRRWLTETEPDRATRDETTLRSFFLWLLEPEQSRDILRRERDAALERLARFEALDASWQPHNPPDRAARIALEAGLRHARARGEWAEWALERVESIGEATATP